MAHSPHKATEHEINTAARNHQVHLAPSVALCILSWGQAHFLMNHHMSPGPSVMTSSSVMPLPLVLIRCLARCPPLLWVGMFPLKIHMGRSWSIPSQYLRIWPYFVGLLWLELDKMRSHWNRVGPKSNITRNLTKWVNLNIERHGANAKGR